LFFVMSAFTLLLSMNSRSHDESHPVRNFFIRRFFRIAPLFYIAAGVSLIFDGLTPRYWAPTGLHLSDILTTMVFLNGWQPHTINSIVPGGWSIAVEMTFYAFLPILFSVIRTFNQSFLAWCVAVAVGCMASSVGHLITGPNCLPYLASEFDNIWFPSQIPIFLSGFMVFFALQEQVRIQRFIIVQISSALLLIAALVTNRIFTLHLHLHVDTALAGICFAVLAYGLTKVKLTIFVNAFTRHTGRVSYSAYISHFWVIRALYPTKAIFLLVPKLFQLPISFCIVTAITILLSMCLYSAIEVPCQTAGRKLIVSLEARDLRVASKYADVADSGYLHDNTIHKL